MISKEQLYYIVKVYPERVTQSEAAIQYALVDDDSYWTAAAKIINELANEPNKVHRTEIMLLATKCSSHIENLCEKMKDLWSVEP